MLYLLFISLMSMLFLAYILTGRDILSPCIISIYMFIITVLIAILNKNSWEEDISSLTVIVVLSALLVFGMGEIFGKSIVSRTSNKAISPKSNPLKLINGKQRIFIGDKWIVISSCVILVVLYFYFNYIKQIAAIAGNNSGIELMLHYARNAQFDPSISTNQSALLNIGITFSRAISIFFLFVFLYNIIFYNFRLKDIKYLIPVILNIGNILLSTGRTQFINLITVFLILFFIMLKQKYKWSTKMNIKILISGFLGILIFLIIFRLSGYLTTKSLNYSLWDNISKYVGAPIIALDKYLQNQPQNHFFGKETFSSIYYVLRKFGVDIPYYSVPNEFISWNNLTNVNIYTAFRRYIQDFTLFGMIFIQFFLGAFYGGFYNLIKLKNKVGLGLIIYAMLFFPIVQMAIEERFFMNITSISGAYNLIAIFVIWYLFTKGLKKEKPKITL